MIFAHLFCLQKSKNDIIQLNDSRNSTDPNLDTRLFTFFTGDTQTVVVVGALLPQTRRFLQVGEVRVKHHDFEVGGFPTSSKSLVLHPDLQKCLAFTTSPDFHGSCRKRPAAELGFSTPASTLPLHPPAPVPCSPASLCWIQGVDLWKTPDGCGSRFTAF